MKKTIIRLILIFMCTFLWGSGAFANDSMSKSVETSADYVPAISNTEAPKVQFDSPEQAVGGRYSCGLINEGSFENGSAWTEWRDPAGISRIVDPSEYCECSGTTVYSYDGTYSWWGGGYSGPGNDIPVSNYVEQEITIPNDATQLRFYMISYRPNDDDPSPEDAFFVIISGETVFSLDMIKENDCCPDWVEQTVDISDYAGQTVTLRFEAQSGDSELTGNVLVDYVRVCSPLRRGLPALLLLLLGD